LFPAIPIVVSTNDITSFPFNVVAYTFGIDTMLILVAEVVELPWQYYSKTFD
jgi:hypothetical protein